MIDTILLLEYLIVIFILLQKYKSWRLSLTKRFENISNQIIETISTDKLPGKLKETVD